MAKTIIEKLPAVVRDKCGTTSGYSAHRERNEITCQPCRNANASYQARQMKTHPEWVARANERSLEYRVENPEKVKASNARYRAKNTEKIKTYRGEHAEKRSIDIKQWRIKNPENAREGKRRRRARRKGNGYEPYTEAQVLERYGTDCHICGEPIDMDAPRSTREKGWERGLHIDHKVAISNGGRDDLENARPSHGLCNLQKSAK